jgi:crotonobetaine/carnitine-CoA ligase
MESALMNSVSVLRPDAHLNHPSPHGRWHTGDQDTLVAALDRAAAAWPDRQWIDFLGQTYTFKDIDHAATRLAHVLMALGVKPGETVISFLDNSVDAIVLWFAINKAGAVTVPINTAYRGEFLRHLVSDAGGRIVIAESDYAERLAQIAPGISSVRLILYRGAAPRMGDCSIACEPLDEHRGYCETPTGIAPLPSDLACLIYTSGTTGPAKGCMISHNYVCNLARQNVGIYEVTEGDTMWTCLPLFHMNAIAVTLVTTLLVGARAAMVPKFSVSGFWPEIVRAGATIASVLGSMAVFVSQAPDNEASVAAFGQLRAVQGAPWPGEIADVWQRRFGIKSQIAARLYGISEACLVTTVSAAVQVPPGTSGRRNADFEVRIVDDNDNELPPGVPGEVVCRPLKPHVMFEGYWRRPDETLKVMRNLWMHLGDIGKFDADGWFYFIDRKKDYLRRRGENISSFEMENVFAQHPAIAEVAVHAVLSKASEDDIKVTAVLHADARLTEEELCRWSIDKLPYFALPRYIEFRAALPRNPVGRVLKFQLRDEGCTTATWDMESSGIKVERR